MAMAMYLVLSVFPATLCLDPDVSRFGAFHEHFQSPRNFTRNEMLWMPVTRHTSASNDKSSITVGTVAERQNINTSIERIKPVISDAPLTKHLAGASVNTSTNDTLLAGRASATTISNLKATGLFKQQPPLKLGKIQHLKHTEDNNETASHILSSLFPISRSNQKYNSLKKGLSSRDCLCEYRMCDCSEMLLTSVPQDLPVNISKLLLDGNNLHNLLNNSFSRYRNLEHLSLLSSFIDVLEEGAFLGLDNLTFLDLSANNIGKNQLPPKNVFEPLRSLRSLLMGWNGFPCNMTSSYFGALFSSLRCLEVLGIDYHGEKYYDPAFKNLTFLHNLTVYCRDPCSFVPISNSTFENVGHLQSLYIIDCRIQGSKIEYGAFSNFTNLSTLDISRNPDIGLEHLPRVMYGLRNSGLQTLIMNNIASKYSINFVNTSVIQYLPKTITKLIARSNNIVYIDHQVFKILPKNLTEVDISNNDITMDPMTIPLADMKKLETLQINTLNDECPISDIEMSRQNKLIFQRLTKSNERRMSWTTTSEHRTKIPLNLRRIEMSIKTMNGNYMKSIDDNNSVEEIDFRCSYLPVVNMNYFAHLPKLTYLDLRNSFIKSFIPPKSNLSRLKTLVLQSNKIDFSSNQIGGNFQGLPNLSDLDLSINQITVLTKEFFEGIGKLEYLRLNGNLFTDFIADISNLHQLKLLNLSNTGLPYLPDLVRTHIDQLSKARPDQIEVDMSGCPIQCDCFNLDFLRWMVSSPAFNKNFTGYKCSFQVTSIKDILDGYKETLHVLTRECAMNYPLYLVIIAGTLIVLCLVMGMIIYRFRWKIRYLYYAAYLKVVDKDRKDNNHQFMYDVFISYDSEDTRFVVRCLLPELQKRDLVLLIHGRDFVAGTSILSNILMAVAESRKTLVVLTRNLLGSIWCNYEIQMATMEAVHTGRQVLVFLLKENIPNRELDVELLRYINSNTYLPYPSPEDQGDEEIMKIFFDKLAHDLKC